MVNKRICKHVHYLLFILLSKSSKNLIYLVLEPIDILVQLKKIRLKKTLNLQKTLENSHIP